MFPHCLSFHLELFSKKERKTSLGKQHFSTQTPSHGRLKGWSFSIVHKICIRGRRGRTTFITHPKSWSSSWSSGWRASANENATTKQKKANFIFSSWRTTNRTTSRMRCIEFSSACVHYNPTVKIDFEIMLNKISELEKVLSFSNASPRLEEGGLSKMSDSSAAFSSLPPSPISPKAPSVLSVSQKAQIETVMQDLKKKCWLATRLY